jgi:hypothetical protein
MSCTNCNKTPDNCGCEQKALHISQICNPINCPVEECSESLSAGCIIYTGEDIICNNVILATSGDTIAQIAANISAYFCEQTTVDVAIRCGLNEVVPAGTTVKDAITLTVAYFCDALANLPPIITDSNVSFLDALQPNGCTIRNYTITFLAGVTVIDTIQFSTLPICPPLDLCASTSVTTLNSSTDTFLICRDSLGILNIRKVSYADLITELADSLPGNILSAYNSQTGIGNGAGVSTVNAVSTAIPANTLAADGDEYEIDLYVEYTENDPVTLEVNIGTGTPWSKVIQNANDDKRFFNIIVSRISSGFQMWTITEHIKDSFGAIISNIEVYYTSVNLAIGQNFTVNLINVAGVAGANDLVLHKAVLRLNKF